MSLVLAKIIVGTYFDPLTYLKVSRFILRIKAKRAIIKKYSAVFLDVDGTLFNSLPTKNRIFIELLLDEGIPVDFSQPIILKTDALTRNNRFKKVWNAFYMEEISNSVLERLISKSNLKLIDEFYSPIPGAELFLSKYGQKLQMHVVTAANEAEVTKNLKKYGWDSQLLSIQFDITDKAEAFKKILDSNKYMANEVLAVGDTELDCIAAMRNNLDFWVIGQALNDQVKNSEYFAGISENFYQVINYLN